MMANTFVILGCFLCAFNILISADRHFAGNEEVHDEGHIKQHLEDKIDVSKLSEEQQRFHYFSISDLNKDNLIDGNEVLKALTHDHSGNTGTYILQ
ncbi:Multiple coagulation factor deficiency protein 2 [Trichostrongylus colubriformis]|uniref:Multiple coagulation factor deficiency protein 2 n=1 Tax=Trichostrongylus colubriformis TaxID=6319 RepID=A0AAN8IPN9_TRICO